MSDFEVLPVGTEKFLNRLGYFREGDFWRANSRPRPKVEELPVTHMTREEKDDARGEGRWMWLTWGIYEHRLYQGELGTERQP